MSVPLFHRRSAASAETERRGSHGQPIVILHGLFGSSDNLGSIAKELATDHEVMLVDQDPLGASSAKALLTLAFGHTYKRIPWTLNDRLAGRALWRPDEAEVPVLKIWPVPTGEVLNLECKEPILQLAVYDATGRLARSWLSVGSDLVQIQTGGLSAGMYVLRCELSGRSIQVRFTKFD